MEPVASGLRGSLFAGDETPLSRSAGYGVTAIGLTEIPLRGVDDIRKKLGPPGGKPFAVNVLKSSDEQTVAGLSALLQAMEHAGLSQEALARWGVIAAPRYLGKLSAAAALHKYASGGAWKVSPMVVPHHCLHAMSGTITQALDIKGPNFGAGGGVCALVDGLITACTLLDESTLPGLWLVLTQCHPEPQFDPNATEDPDVSCYGIALGFTPVANSWRGLRLRIVRSHGPAGTEQPEDVHQFFELYQFLRQVRDTGEFTRWSCVLDWRASFVFADQEYAIVQNKAA